MTWSRQSRRKVPITRSAIALAGAESLSQDPQQLVPQTKLSTWSASDEEAPRVDGVGAGSREGDLAWARRSLHGCEQEPEKFEHTISIADLCSSQVCRSTGPFLSINMARRFCLPSEKQQ